MTDIRILKGDRLVGGQLMAVSGPEDLTVLVLTIKAMIYEYEPRLPLAAAIGVLHLVADEIIRDHD